MMIEKSSNCVYIYIVVTNNNNNNNNNNGNLPLPIGEWIFCIVPSMVILCITWHFLTHPFEIFKFENLAARTTAEGRCCGNDVLLLLSWCFDKKPTCEVAMQLIAWTRPKTQQATKSQIEVRSPRVTKKRQTREWRSNNGTGNKCHNNYNKIRSFHRSVVFGIARHNDMLYYINGIQSVSQQPIDRRSLQHLVKPFRQS
jgi:hypothetical protein